MVAPRRIGSLLCALALAMASGMPLAAGQSVETGRAGAETGRAGAESRKAGATAGFDAASFARELPRQAMPRVPVFVGPASLELVGTRGAWRWPEVRFGADEAGVRVRLVPAGASCKARLRVRQVGVPALEAWFEATSEESAILDSVLAVGYAQARLRIDSDCREWSMRFVPQSDRDLVAVIEERYYPVRGDSIEELATQVDQLMGRWAAYSEWQTSWTFATGRAGDGTTCSVVEGGSAVHVSMTLPSWKRPSGVEPAVEARWEGFMQSLRVHEQGHVTIALQGAAAIAERLDAGFSAASCEAVSAQADAAARRIFERFARDNRRYDKETRHGLAQGTGLR